jgi:hypothetical protein
MFNLSNYLKYIYSVLLLNIIYHTSYYSCVLGMSLPDLITRVDFNCLGLSNLYWLWTNTYYLYTLFLLSLFLVLSNYHAISTSVIVYMLLFYVLFMLLEAAYNLNMIIYLTPIDNLLTLYNLLLNNSINKIHPLLIYAVLVFTISHYFRLSNLTLYSYRSSTRFINSASLIKLSLLLGGWWAYQEGSWGGWWNWDPSEMFGLLIFSTTLMLVHSSPYLNIKNHQYVKVSAITLIVYYSFLQLNFSLISHNFGIRQGDIVDFRVLYFALLVYLLYWSKVKLTNLTRAYTWFNITPITVYSLIVASTLYIILYSSTLDLWSTLIWNITRVDIYNTSGLLSYVNLLLLTLLALHYTKYSFSLILLLALNYFHVPALLYMLIYILIRMNFRSMHAYSHQLLLILLTTLLYYSSISLVTFDVIPKLLSSFNSSLNTPLVIDVISIFNNSTINKQSATCSLVSNTADVKLFSLINSAYSSLQQYIINIYDITISSNSIDKFNMIVVSSIAVYGFITYAGERPSLMIIRH